FEANRTLGLALQRQGHLDEAFERYQHCPPDRETRDLLYQLGLDYEERGMAEKALSVYERIKTADYKDVQDRIRELRSDHFLDIEPQYLSGRQNALSESFIQAKQQVGRYQILEKQAEINKKLWEMEREKKIEAQREELIELSTPVIDVWDGVLTVPILGSLDSERASRVSEALLTEIVEKRAAVAIIDISGISAVDSAVADRLIRTAKAVRLVGAEAILTGVGVEIAQTIADLGIDMEGLKTMSTLKDGLRYVISRKNLSKEIVSKND
ncbi:MAG: STAS domain-containing protein, partial [candidate division WOR-3 bacterium]